MNLHEYQGKDLLRQYGIEVPCGAVASSAEEAVAAARAAGAGPWYIKAQVLAGGRASGHFKHAPGSEGGVRRCDSLEQVKQHAEDMLGQVLFTVQTGIDGVTVHQVYIENAIDVSAEVYVALLVDRRSSCVALMTSRSGGAFIEQSYASDPESLAIWVLDIDVGLDAETARGAAESLGFDGERIDLCADALTSMYQLFVEKDCSLIEINPLAISTDGQVCALDATVKIDDNALRRQPQLAQLRDTRDLRDGELDALRHGFNYFKLDGDIGIVASGASMAMATLDTVKLYAGEPANFLDIPPVADTPRFIAAIKLVLSDPSVKTVLVNVFGGGVMRCDDVVTALLQARAETDSRLPVVVRLAGTRSELAAQMLAEQAADIVVASDMVEAARISVESVASTPAPSPDRAVRASWWERVRRIGSRAEQ